MEKLDNVKQIKKLDPQNVLASMEALAPQITQVWREFKTLKLPPALRQIDKIIINGMGGSGLGGHVIRSLYFETLRLPLELVNGYAVPGSLDARALYIFSSYSGTTEEPLSTLAQAKKRRAKLFGIASGGTLGSWVKKGIIPGYAFDPRFNPSNQPRMGLGYSLAAQLALFHRLGLIKVTDAEIRQALKSLQRCQRLFGVNNPAAKNPAKILARQLNGRLPVVVAAEFLAGNAHVFANQINENAKTFAAYFLIPELNHHLLESLSYPKTNRRNLAFVFFESAAYAAKNQTRFKITQKVMTKNRVAHYRYRLASRGRLGQSLEMLLFGSYVSFYLAALNGINPSLIPWVDYFKSELKRQA